MTNPVGISILEFVVCSHLLLFGGYLLLKVKGHWGMRWLGAFLFILGLHFALLAAVDVLSAKIGFFVFRTSSFLLASYGPILFLAVKYFTGAPARPLHGLHFLFLLIPSIAYHPALLPLAQWPMVNLSLYRILLYGHNLIYVVLAFRFLQLAELKKEVNRFLLVPVICYGLMVSSYIFLLLDADLNNASLYLVYKVFFLLVLIVMVDYMLVLTLKKPVLLSKWPKVPTADEKDYNRKVLVAVDDFLWGQQHFTNADITLVRVSEKLGFSTRDISKSIHLSYQKSFREYLNTLRINHASELLRENPELRISEVMYKSGYNSKSLFIKNFKEQFHMAPNEYRQSVLVAS